MRQLLCLSNTFICMSFFPCWTSSSSLSFYLSGASWDLKSLRFSQCSASEVDPFIKCLGSRQWWFRRTHTLLHKPLFLLYVFYQHVSHNNVFLSSHPSLFSYIFSPASWTNCERIWSELQPQITKTAWFPIKITHTHTLIHTWSLLDM